MAVSQGLYRHYKGTKVCVLSVVTHTETKEDMVVYIHLEDGRLWTRPQKMFEEIVQQGSEFVSRFTKL